MDDAAGKKALLEALVFLSAGPLSARDVKALAGLDEAEAEDLLGDLASEYAERAGGVRISRVAGGFQMHTDPALGEALSALKGKVKPQKLSMAALETLSVIAYRQPITKAEVEDVRGVNSDGVVKSLLDKRLIKIMGKKEAPGRPLLYGTTREFLQYFGLEDLTGLPTLKDLEREDAA